MRHFVLLCFNDLIDFFGGPSIDLLITHSFVSRSKDKQGDIRRCFTQKKTQTAKSVPQKLLFFEIVILSDAHSP